MFLKYLLLPHGAPAFCDNNCLDNIKAKWMRGRGSCRLADANNQVLHPQYILTIGASAQRIKASGVWLQPTELKPKMGGGGGPGEGKQALFSVSNNVLLLPGLVTVCCVEIQKFSEHSHKMCSRPAESSHARMVGRSCELIRIKGAVCCLIIKGQWGIALRQHS